MAHIECQQKAKVSQAILNGPSKRGLTDALFGGDENHRLPVTFYLEVGTMSVLINDIERADGSGESWNFQGMLFGNRMRVVGFYSTRTRKGTIAPS